jgi:hypothetical protein
MTADAAANSSVVRLERLPDGRFAPGSGGRPLGSKNRISNEALTAVRGMKDAAIEQLRSKLANGDWEAVVFVLNRILPKDRPVELDDMSPTTIATALANGDLTPEEGRAIAATVARLKEIGELEQLRDRIQQLEQMIAGNGSMAR